MNHLILFQLVSQLFQSHLLKNPSFPRLFCVSLLYIKLLDLLGSLSGLSVLFHWSVILLLHQYHNMFINGALYFQCTVSSTALFFFGCYEFNNQLTQFLKIIINIFFESTLNLLIGRINIFIMVFSYLRKQYSSQNLGYAAVKISASCKNLSHFKQTFFAHATCLLM